MQEKSAAGGTTTNTADQDYNLPGEEHRGILRRLQENVGNVPVHFWAQCQLCDIKCLEALVTVSDTNPDMVQLIARQAKIMMACCKLVGLVSSFLSFSYRL
jgi:hypothetical protein